MQRITINELLKNEWFKKGFKAPVYEEEEGILDDDINSIFNESAVRILVWLPVFFFVSKELWYFATHQICVQDSPNLVVERRDEGPPAAPVAMNAFELISTAQGLNLNSLFEKQMVCLVRS